MHIVQHRNTDSPVQLINAKNYKLWHLCTVITLNYNVLLDNTKLLGKEPAI